MRSFSLIAIAALATGAFAAPKDLENRAAANDFQTTMLQLHNQHRANHGVGALTWDAGLAAAAADEVKSCVFAHNVPAGAGQNIAAGGGGAKQAVDMWYNEVKQYNSYGKEPANWYPTGHFTQLVWKDTTKLGCATKDCPGNPMTFCNYKGPGNFAGQYAKNVFPAKK